MMRSLLASKLVVSFDIAVDTNSAGASSASDLFDSVVSDLTAGVENGDITSAIVSDSAFDGLNVSVVKAAYTAPTTYTSEYVASPTAAPHKSNRDDDGGAHAEAVLAASIAVPMVVAVLGAALCYWYTNIYVPSTYEHGNGKGGLDGGGMQTPTKRNKEKESGAVLHEMENDADTGQITIDMAPSPSRRARGNPVVMNGEGQFIEIHRSPAAPVAPQQMKTWRKLFDAMDINRDGVVTAAELAQTARESAKDPAVFRQLQEELGILDHMMEGELHDSDVLTRVFEAIDVDSDQKITFDEFYAHLSLDADAKKLVFRPGQKMRLKEGHSVIL